MFNSAIIDVALGMAFTYLLLSLIASVIQELIAGLVQSRSANLQRGLRSLLSGDSISAASTLVDDIYQHGLIRGLYQDPQTDLKLVVKIDPQIGGLTWIDRFRIWLQRRVGLHPIVELKDIKNPLLLPAYIPARTFALAMIDILNRDKGNGQAPIINIQAFLNVHHAEFCDNKAVQALLALAENSRNDLKAFQTNLENWYNDAMDRVSGWYKRYTQNVLLCIGLLLAIVFNVDSVRITQTLWFDRDIRQAMVGAATSFTQTGTAPGQQGPKTQTELMDQMNHAIGAFESVGRDTLLPVGWPYPWSHYLDRYHSLGIDGSAWEALKRVFGWCLTAAALSFGAPFWFDTLNKIMVVRNTIKPQEKSQTEPSKDK